ncbi:alpha/beta hydrolase [Streptacidiphilus sp. ASG 303]|uniref:alpha/beta fold hydrolase n=1 Tax=Streptacidiphilus sp. ASG 303 TaxID=2896847 RepID=UPI001E2D8BCB|nr:alpha/beta hydrolase [Streptacidiphilus sp. ASG 303]MCD0486428.1 alpha/beta hydrolase [Streptacidiphilus sp. ASG 303]
MADPAVGNLRVDGATLHCEVRGEGPLLLLILGGMSGAACFDAVVDDLAAECAVATYDPRGMARSAPDDPEAEQQVAERADDALRMLDLLSPGRPARVFGAGWGAVAALHLLTTRPERVERVVAHEPPVVEVLPDASEHRALIARVQEAFRTQGTMPAMALPAAGLKKDGGAGGPQAGPPPQAAARDERTMADMRYFVGRVTPAFMSYAPDTDRLAALSDRLVVACGGDSQGGLPHRAGAAPAGRLGTEFVHFPGGHTGLNTHAADFGALLLKTLRAPL